MNSAAEDAAGGEGAATAARPPGRGLQLRRSVAVSGNEPEPEPGREQDVVAHVYDVACSGPDGNGGGGATVLHINRIFKDAIGLGGIFHTTIQSSIPKKTVVSWYNLSNFLGWNVRTAPPRTSPSCAWVVCIASGHSLLRDPRHNKGLSFTEMERNAHYLRGLLPPVVLPQELQEKWLLQNVGQLEPPCSATCSSWNSRRGTRGSSTSS